MFRRIKRDLKFVLCEPFLFLGSCVQGYNLVPIELQKVYRQTDPVFINVLDRIRNNAARKQELDTLNGRYFPSFEPQRGYVYYAGHSPGSG